MRLYLLPYRRARAYILWLSFVLMGLAVGLLRTPPTTASADFPEVVAAEPAASDAFTRTTPAEEAPSLEVTLVSYTVRSGDTLSSIAKMFNTSSDSIAYINGISSPDRISVGKQLSVMQNASGVVVKVSTGDTLGAISKRYGVSVADIVEANHLASPDQISVGQILLLPGATPARPVQTLARSSPFAWPAKGSITSAFGWRIHPVTKESSRHDGIDIANSSGTDVYAAASGTITFAGWYAGYGRLVTIDHGGGITSWYGHLSSLKIKKGDVVRSGDVIGLMGQSGNATGPHLHFEVRKNDNPVNPRSYLP